MPNTLIHLASNLLLLAGIYFFDKEYNQLNKKFLTLTLWITGTLAFDIDHLLATPIYDPLRCSINFHPLHSWYMFPIYIGGLLLKNKTIKYVSLAILIHVWLDWLDCFLF